MPTLWLNQRGSSVHLESESLRIKIRTESGGERECEDDQAEGRIQARKIPLHDLESVVIGSGVSLSTPAQRALLRRQIPITWLDSVGGILGQVIPPEPKRAQVRLVQADRCRDPEFVTSISRTLIQAKVRNQRRVLQKLLSPESPSYNLAQRELAHLLQQLDQAEGPSVVMGFEGAASARFYRHWAQRLPESFPFERRTRRPPQNPVNAVLSFVSTILYSEMTAATVAAGLDPGFSALHSIEDGRWSLPLDLIEPFRPVIVEPLCLDLFGRGILAEEDFRPHDGGIYLHNEGRRKLILQYERRLQREFVSAQLGIRTSLRQRIREAPYEFRRALDPDKLPHFTSFHLA